MGGIAGWKDIRKEKVISMAPSRPKILVSYLRGKWPTYKFEMMPRISLNLTVIAIDGVRAIMVSDEFLQTETWGVILPVILDEVEKYFKLELIIGS